MYIFYNLLPAIGRHPVASYKNAGDMLCHRWGNQQKIVLFLYKIILISVQQVVLNKALAFRLRSFNFASFQEVWVISNYITWIKIVVWC